MGITRREFLRDAALVATAMGLGDALVPRLATALETLADGRAPVLWLQGQSCSGCSVSLLNSDQPGPADLLTRYLSLYFHQTLSAATGSSAVDAVEAAIGAGGYVLVAEGSVPAGMPAACVIHNEHYGDLLKRAARKAQAVLAVGTCSSFGGIPAAESNPTGAVSTMEWLSRNSVAVPVINIPGCPPHPAWMVGTIAYLLRVGIPELDEEARPKGYFGKNLHEQCPHFAAYERQEFASAPGEPGCQFKVGCQGVVTNADCSHRGWNSGVNWCVRAMAPCVGCTRPEFSRYKKVAFYRLNEIEG